MSRSSLAAALPDHDVADELGEIVELGLYDIPRIGKRIARAFIPPRFRSRRAPWPLLFMWDGQNVFGDEGSYVGGWQVHELVRRRVRRNLPVPIVVGLHHGGEARVRELSPFPLPHGAPLLDPLLEWVCNRFMATLRREFPLTQGPHGVVVAGSSMGGLASLYAHLKRPDVFGGAWVMSPSLFLARAAIFDVIAATPKPWTTRVYLDAGKLESGGRLAALVERTAAALKRRGWNDDEICVRIAKRGTHNERHWRARSIKAMRFFYG